MPAPKPVRQPIVLPPWGAPRQADTIYREPDPEPVVRTLLDDVVESAPVSLLDGILRQADPQPMPRLDMAPVEVPLSSLLADILDGGARATDEEIADAYRIDNNLNVARLSIAFRHRIGRDQVAKILAARRETAAQTMARRKLQTGKPCPTCGMVNCPYWGMP